MLVEHNFCVRTEVGTFLLELFPASNNLLFQKGTCDMSADNGIYILHTADGYRVAELEAVENLTWNCVFDMDFYAYHWGKSKLFATENDVWEQAEKLLAEIDASDYPVCEYGIVMLEYEKINITQIPAYEKCTEEQKCDYYPTHPLNVLNGRIRSYSARGNGLYKCVLDDGSILMVQTHFSEKNRHRSAPFD